MSAGATSRPTADPYGILAALRAGRPGYVPEWPFPSAGAGAGLVAVVADFLATIRRRLDRAPDKARLAFFDLLGIQPTPARPAQAVVVFTMADGAADARLAAGTRITAAGQITFETPQVIGLSSARLRQVASFWPGRDQWIDHSAAVAAGQTIYPFRVSDLQNVAHALYLGHDTLLALSGQSTVQVAFELTTPGSEALPIDWQYWDGTLWRSFLSDDPGCGRAWQAPDGTGGLRASGRVVLTAGCADSMPVAVNGVTSHWIRGVLSQPLPPDPSQTLPQVHGIKLGVQIARPLTFRARQAKPTPGANSEVVGMTVQVQTDGGAPLEGIRVSWTEDGNPMTGAPGDTGPDGTVSFTVPAIPAIPPGPSDKAPGSLSVLLNAVGAGADVDKPQLGRAYKATFTADGLRADKAFADQLSLDLTKTFYPFGLSPQAGAAFYFKCDEAFTKPGATLQVLTAKAQTAQDQSLAPPLATPALLRDEAPAVGTAGMATTGGTGLTDLQPAVAWEYWNGGAWVELGFNTSDAKGDLDRTEIISLTVPEDLDATTVNGVKGRWMRVRLVSGGFGKYGVFSASLTGAAIPFLLSRAPALADFRLGYTWIHGPYPPEHTLSVNDFRFEDHTAAVLWSGPPFLPFQTTTEVAPALYLGFSKPLMPDNDLGVYFEIEEQPDAESGPPLAWEYWDGFGWQRLDAVNDPTAGLVRPGVVSFIGPINSQALARFGTALHWVRARLKEDGPPGAPAIDGVFLNALTVVQQQTIVNEPMGASTGLPNQVFAFRQVPVLGGDEVEVQESSGAAANVEWRALAQDAAGPDAVTALQDLLAAEGAQTDVVWNAVRLVRDRAKRVTEVWVRWRRRTQLFQSGPHDRDYAVDAARGKLTFGDGINGKIPPAGGAVQAARYVTGGGAAGNVAAGAISQLQGAVGGLQSVSNPLPAGGGADGETVEALLRRAPATLRHRGRGTASADYEALAREASPGVAAAYAHGAVGPDGLEAPGWVTLVLLPGDDAAQPWPSYGLRQEVLAYVAARAPADVAAAGQINVTGPQYQPIDVAATIVPLDPTQAGAVADAARAALLRFLHPVSGGPAGNGWPPNRAVYLSDVAAALGAVEGIDYVRDLTLLLGGAPQGAEAAVSGGRIAAAGDLRIKLV